MTIIVWEVITAKIGALDKRRCFPLRWCFYAQRFEQRGSFLVHTWWFCQKDGGVFILYVLDIGGASDGHVVLLTERRCCFC